MSALHAEHSSAFKACQAKMESGKQIYLAERQQVQQLKQQLADLQDSLQTQQSKGLEVFTLTHSYVLLAQLKQCLVSARSSKVSLPRLFRYCLEAHSDQKAAVMHILSKASLTALWEHQELLDGGLILPSKTTRSTFIMLKWLNLLSEKSQHCPEYSHANTDVWGFDIACSDWLTRRSSVKTAGSGHLHREMWLFSGFAMFPVHIHQDKCCCSGPRCITQLHLRFNFFPLPDLALLA